MAQTAVKPQPEVEPRQVPTELLVEEVLEERVQHDWQAKQLRVIWGRRKFLFRAVVCGMLASGVLALVLPKSYTATTQLMPPDEQSLSNVAMMAGLAARVGGSLGSVAGDLLGLKSSGALFIGMLRSQTSQEHVVDRFDLQKVYGTRLMTKARETLDENTSISENLKSGIISISVTDHNPQRAASIANAYVDELNSLVSELSTSSAHRERVFLEQRLQVVKRELDDASNQLAQFSSKNSTLDIQTEGKAMLDAAATVAGQLIAAQSELEGLRQIYTDNNARVRTLQARVATLRSQMQKLGGSESGNQNSVREDSGEADDPAPNGSNPTDSPFPTIRNLPLLGAKYADYYRRAKTEETVYELLTEQYELAKVEEAKETPSVKVLDQAQVPELKSFPHRLLIIFLGTFLVISVALMWVVGESEWKSVDPSDPRKVLAQEIVTTMKARIPWRSKNGAGNSSA